VRGTFARDRELRRRRVREHALATELAFSSRERSIAEKPMIVSFT